MRVHDPDIRKELKLEKFSTSDSFIGEIFNGKFSGRGIFVRKDGSREEGYWYKDRLEGFGRIIKANGYFYEGEFNNGIAEGQGKYKFSNGETYSG